MPNSALLCSTIATAVQHTVFDPFVANGIRQLQNRLSTEIRTYPAGSPLQRAILDIASDGRRGPGHRALLTRAEVEHVSRTARRVPEDAAAADGAAERQWIGRELQERVVRARELERGYGR